VRAWIEHFLRDDDVGIREGSFGVLGATGFPVEDVVVGLVLLVVAMTGTPSSRARLASITASITS